MKCCLLVISACLCCVPRTVGQDLNGFAIGMSKLETCRYLEQHPSHSLQGPTKCREMDDRVTVAVTSSGFAEIREIALAFDHRGTISAIWSKFPAANFNPVYVAAREKFGKPTWEKEYRAGRDDASFPNKLVYWHTKKADIYLEQQNKVENGEQTGWLALDPPASSPIIPPASFTVWDTSKSHSPSASWGDRATLSER